MSEQNEETISGYQLKSGTPDSILSSLYHRVLFDLGINNERFQQLMVRYIVNARIPTNLREKSTAKGNLKKELMSTSMTWKTFIKGLRFLNISRFEIVLKAHHRNGKVTEHVQSVILFMEDNVKDVSEVEKTESKSLDNKEKG